MLPVALKNLSKNDPSSNLIIEVMFPTAWRRPIVPQALPTVCLMK
uniref:Uncharacterized protein MANES_02G042700 n=1 Tax=Rhizophora mucronata TaxID=61149 RepID=A0A2P2JZC2_RHIMU